MFDALTLCVNDGDKEIVAMQIDRAVEFPGFHYLGLLTVIGFISTKPGA
jgi:hypothetical protein